MKPLIVLVISAVGLFRMGIVVAYNVILTLGDRLGSIFVNSVESLIRASSPMTIKKVTRQAYETAVVDYVSKLTGAEFQRIAQ